MRCNIRSSAAAAADESRGGLSAITLTVVGRWSSGTLRISASTSSCATRYLAGVCARTRRPTQRNYSRLVRRAAWISFCIAAAALLGLAIWLGWRAVALLESGDLQPSEKASALQAMGSAAALAATVALVGLTGYYAFVSGRMLKIAGPVIAVELRLGWLHPSGAGAITAPFSVQASSPMPEYTIRMFAITVRNSGNAGVMLESVSVAAESGFEFTQPQHVVGPSCPMTLGPHSSATFYLESEGFLGALPLMNEIGKHGRSRVCAKAYLGSGGTIASRWATP